MEYKSVPADGETDFTLLAVKYERIKFLVIALKNSVEIYAWAPKPYHKFMAFKVGDGRRWSFFLLSTSFSFADIIHSVQASIK